MERLDGMEWSEKASAALTITTSAVLLTMLAGRGQPTRRYVRPEGNHNNGLG